MDSQLRQFVCEITGSSPEQVRVEPLAGDASTRRYFRIRFSNRLTYETAILMWLPELPPEGELPFINVRRHLARAGVQVPQIYHFSKEHQCLLLEDFGDDLLQKKAAAEKQEEVRRLYLLALEEIFKMQRVAAKQGGDCVAFSLAFDEEKLNWELNFFLEHTLCGWLRAQLKPAELKTVRAFFSTLSCFLAAQPRVFTHRDYHSRNLLVQDEKIKVIDFQDARMGPGTYDLASLVWDAYADLPASLREELVAVYRAARKEQQKKKFFDAVFEKELDWMTLQRSLKAAGTFGFMARARENRSYLHHLPSVLAFAQKAMEKYPEFGDAYRVLEQHLFKPEAVKK